MEIFYDNKLINNGEFLQVDKTQSKPIIKLNLNPNKFYTLILHDPDAVGGNKIHWAIINIVNNNIKNGKDIIPYKGPQPPTNSGIHHYKFELYEQSNYHNVKSINERFLNMYQIRDKLKLNNHKPKFKIQFKIQSNKDVLTYQYLPVFTFTVLLLSGFILNNC